MQKKLTIHKISADIMTTDDGEKVPYANALVLSDELSDKNGAVGFESTKYSMVDAKGDPDLELAGRLKDAIRSSGKALELLCDLNIITRSGKPSVVITGISSQKAAT